MKIKIGTTIALAGILLCSTAFEALADDDGPSWYDRISFGGDVRLRHERIDEDDKSVRTRQRIRARFAIDAELDEALSAHFRLASGSDDPVSTNQTFGDGFSTKDFGLDRAYLKYSPEECGFTMVGGKVPMPLYTVKDLMFDSDLNPEGWAAMYTAGIGDGVDLTLTGTGFWAEERSSDSDTLLWSGQALLGIEIAEDTTLETGGGYVYWDNIEGYEPIFDEGDSFGNTTVIDSTGTSVYATDYGIFNYFAKIKTDIGIPFAFYVDYALNTEEDVSGPGGGEDQAWMVGATLGKAKKPGSWQFDYNYREVEADAFIGAFSDSDSGGGGTNIDGHKIQGKYQIASRLQGSVSLYVNEIGIRSGEDSRDYNRLQVDLIAKL